MHHHQCEENALKGKMLLWAVSGAILLTLLATAISQGALSEFYASYVGFKY